MTVSVQNGPSHGTLVLQTNGSYSYVPASNFNGSDSFSYNLSDGSATVTASVTITVTSANDVPVAGNDTAQVNEDGSVVAQVMSNNSDVEGDTLTVTAILSQPTHGTAALNANGTIIYVPAVNYSGVDSLQYRVSDGQGGFATATLSLTVISVNDGPTALFSYSIGAKREVALTASASSDIDGSIVSYSWDFGDGSSYTSANPAASHTFRRGTFTVTLVVTDNSGATASYQQVITL